MLCQLSAKCPATFPESTTSGNRYIGKPADSKIYKISFKNRNFKKTTQEIRKTYLWSQTMKRKKTIIEKEMKEFSVRE